MTSLEYFMAASAFLLCGILIERHTGDDEDMFTGVVLLSVWGVSAWCFIRLMFKLTGVSE